MSTPPLAMPQTSYAKLMDLARNNPTVYMCMALVQREEIELIPALIECIAELVRQNEAQNKAMVDYLNSSTHRL